MFEADLYWGTSYGRDGWIAIVFYRGKTETKLFLSDNLTEAKMLLQADYGDIKIRQLTSGG